MLNKTKRVLALMLAVVMVFALVGCSKVEDEGSSVLVEYITEYETIQGESTSSGDEGAQTSTPGTSTPGTTSSGTSSTEKPSEGESNDFADSPVKANPADYKGTKIIFASTIDPKDDGTDYVVSKFEQKYGIEVEITVPTLENYNAEMTALIQAGKAPTVGRSNGDAPIYVGYFDSLDKAQLNFEHELWNQNTFKLSTYNGKPYLCDTMGNFWTEIDMVAYSKSLLKKANCPTPEELDAQGNWTFDSYLMIGKETAKLEGCEGASYNTLDGLLNMGGGTVYRPDANNYMTNGIDANTTVIVQKIAQGFKDKYLISGATEGLINNTVSITTTHLWSLRTDGNLAKHTNYNDLGFYYLPAFQKGDSRPVTGLFRGWGIMRKCNENPATGPKSAVAGGLFLSEYLNVDNYNLNKSFLTEEAKTFFFKLCALYAETENYNPYYTTYDLNEGISGIDDDNELWTIMKGSDPAQVPSMMAAVKSVVEKGCKNLNNYIDQQINSHD